MFNFSKFLKKCQLTRDNYLNFVEFEHGFWHYKFAYFYLGFSGVIFFLSPLLENGYNIKLDFHMRGLNNALAFSCLLLIAITFLSQQFKRIKQLRSILIIWWYTMLFVAFPFYQGVFLVVNNFQHYANTQLIISLLILSCFLQPKVFLVFVLLGYLLAYLYSTIIMHCTIDVHNISQIFVMLNAMVIVLGMSLSYLREVMVKNLMFQTTELEAINVNLEDLINQRTLEIEENLKLKTDFVNNASHEIRIPLQGILSITEILSSQWKILEEKQRYDYINLINHSCTRLMIFASNLLDFAKFHAGKTILHNDVNNLSKLIYEAAGDFMPFIASKNINLKIVSPEKEVIFLFDKVKIEQIIRNLLSNSLKYSDANSNILIQLCLKKDLGGKDIVEICFIDEGVGVAESDKYKIFEAFTQGSKSFSSLNSTGLGLALVAEYVKMHNGKIWVENNEPKGAKFIIHLPYVDKEKDYISLKSAAETHFLKSSDAQSAIVYVKEGDPSIATNSNKKSISDLKGLIIDDEIICLSSTTLMLATIGLQLDQEQDGHNFVAAIQKSQPDFILLDIMLNGISGVDILKSLKLDDRYKHIPIILQSGVVNADVISDAMHSGAFAHLIKPYTKLQVMDVLAKLFPTITIKNISHNAT